MSINPGRLREVVTIQTASNATNDEFGRPSGGQEAQWSDEATVRAEVSEESGSSNQRGGRNDADRGVTVLMRDHPDLSRDARLKYNGDTLRIQSIRQSGRMRRMREVNCVFSGD